MLIILKVFIDGKWKDYNGAREADAMVDHMKMVMEKRGSKGGSKKCPKGNLFNDAKKDSIVVLCKDHFPDNKSKNSWMVSNCGFLRSFNFVGDLSQWSD